MATRQTRLVTKNSNEVARPLPTSLLLGEAIVNTADGIMYFSGNSTTTSEWTAAGTGATEQTFFEVGSNLYDLKLRNRITQYEGKDGNDLIGKFLSGTTNGFVLADINSIAGVDTYVTGFTYNDNTFTITDNSGNTFNSTFNTVTGLTVNGDLDITGNTNTDTLSANTLTVNGITITGDTYVTGGTYFTGGTLELEYNTGGNFQVTGLTQDLDIAISGLAETDEVTIELDLTTNKIRLKDIVGAPSGGTRVFLGNTEIGTGGSFLSGGTGNLVVHGDLTVFGTETIVATNELYVEDPQVTLNYNPTGSTTATSVSSGIRIQDGNGVTSGDTYFTIGEMYNFSGDTTEYTGLTGYENRGWVTQLNDIVIRNTNLNDGAPDGVRVLAEGDILDGGGY
jgi:hypothetical protein